MEAVMRSHGRLELARLRKPQTMTAVFEERKIRYPIVFGVYQYEKSDVP